MIQREQYMNQIRPFIGTEMIKVLTGMRRSGKSVMLELIKEELLSQGIPDTQFITFNFESFANANYCTAHSLYQELSNRISKINGKAYLFFDEIQEVTEWEKCINSARIDFDCDIYITGSNAKLLSGELATYLGGRYVEFEIFPFSFSEFLEAMPSTDIPSAFRAYVRRGGMPFLTNIYDNENACIQYLNDIYNSVILKDVVKGNNIRDIDLLERIISFAVENIGQTFSATSISKYLKSENRKVSTETVLNYLKACCDAFLFHKIKREDVIGKKILSVSEKYYIPDHGFREAIFTRNNRDIDRVLENIMCLELLRRGYRITIGKVNDKEIDFIAEKNGGKIYIQVSYLLSTADTVEREFSPYDHVHDNYPKYVVTMDEFDFSRNGIKHKNIRDFLLEKNWD